MSRSADDAQKLGNSYSHDDAKASIAFISEQRQIIADASMKIASEMKSIEKRGGNRAAIQFTMRALKQDPAKTRREIEAMDQYREWFIKPVLDDVAGEGSEG